MAYRKEAVGRIRREVDALHLCKVPELVKLASIPTTECTIDGLDYVVYSEEFIDGSDLWDLIRGSGTRPMEPELRALFGTLIRAIRELWSHGFIHRDIKPLNIMTTKNSTRPFVLLDLGIAFCVRETALTYNPLGRLPPATYRYMAPEMAHPNFRDNLDHRSDLYSAALSIYEYATGIHPYARDYEDPVQTISRAVHDLPLPLRQHRGDLSLPLCQLVDQMLRKNPALRPSNLDRSLAIVEAQQ